MAHVRSGGRAEAFLLVDAAFRAGDLAALRAAVGDESAIPNGRMPPGIGSCLEYAIYHSPLSLIRELLELGADPNLEDPGGFPPLIAALSSGSREDVIEIVELLLAFGADPNQRGLNDYTALHLAVTERSTAAVELLLRAGGDPTRRTRIDDYESPLDLARRHGLVDMEALMRDSLEDRGTNDQPQNPSA